MADDPRKIELLTLPENLTITKQGPSPISLSVQRYGIRTLPSRASAAPDALVPNLMPALSLSTKVVVKNPTAEELTTTLTGHEKRVVEDIMRAQIRALPEFDIEETIFSLYSDEEIEKMSVVNVTSSKQSGLETVNDLRLGTVERNIECNTCNTTNLQCPGHYGRIELDEPFALPYFVRIIVMILQLTCNYCGGLLVTEEELRKKGILAITGINRLKLLEKYITQLRKNTKDKDRVICRRQNGETLCIPPPEYLDIKSIITNGKIMVRKFEPVQGQMQLVTRELKLSEARDILSAITEEDAKLLGFTPPAHPQFLIRKNIIVPPLCVRPPANRDGLPAPDDITETLRCIVKNNEKIKQSKQIIADKNAPAKAKKKASEELEKTIGILNRTIRSMIDGGKGKAKGGNKMIPVRERLGGKSGMMRKNMTGKTGDQTGRTVLSTGPELNDGEIGLPRTWAAILTYPELVTVENLPAIMELLEGGRVVRIQIDGDPDRRRLVNVQDPTSYIPQPGDIIERQIQDGDYVAFGRNPTLHRYGLMGHKVVLHDYLTIQLPITHTPHYNADYDGDEGNIFVPQSIEAAAELQTIMYSRHCLINAQDNRPLAGLVMNDLTAIYLMTQKDIVVDNDTRFDALMKLSAISQLTTLNQRLDKYKQPRNSGQALFSALLPEDFYYQKDKIRIMEGVLLSGPLTKNHMGRSHRSIVQIMAQNYGVARASQFLNDSQFVLKRWLDVNPITVSMKDCYSDDPKVKEMIDHETERARVIVEEWGPKLRSGTAIERKIARTNIQAHLNRVSTVGETLIESNLDKDNNIVVMAVSGSKGKKENVGQIVGVIGLQFKGTEMFVPNYQMGESRLTIYSGNRLDIEGLGFIKGNFLHGMNVSESIFHWMAAREGVVDTSIKTVEPGTMQRRLTQTTQNVRTEKDGTVRDAMGPVVQWSYGDTGFDPSRLINIDYDDGVMAFFVDVESLAGQLNAQYGYGLEM